MLKVGLTGGIGSGKSTVCQHFLKLDISIFDSDRNAKLHYHNKDVKNSIVKAFGIDVVDNNDDINLTALAQIVFSNQSQLNILSDILQPYILDDFKYFCQQNSHRKYCIFESAIIYERQLSHLFDKMIVVIADKEERIKRVMERNSLTRDEVLQKMNCQLENDDEDRIKKSDFIIYNNTDSDDNLYEKVYKIHSQLIK